MKVGQEQIVKAVVSYAEDEILSKIDEKTTLILLAFSVNMLKANPKIADPIFKNPLIKIALGDDGSGQYEVDTVCSVMADTLKNYGKLPINLPGVPLLKIPENTFTFGDSDVAEIRKRIERGNE